jgi:hypothetical protein
VWRFQAKSGLETEDEDWQLETWSWLLKSLGGSDDLKLSPLVVPTREFFPPTEAQGHRRVEQIFDAVKKLARLEDWECELKPQPDRGDGRLGPVAALRRKPGPAGTFSVQGNKVLITYDPQLENDPWGLVATLAHELAHYLLVTIPEEPPGGDANHEFATDLAAVYLGFGVFNANTAFRFSQHTSFDSQGWKYQRAGYLSEKEWCFALAVFLFLRGDDPKLALTYLKPSLQTDLRRCLKYLTAHPEKTARLLQVQPQSNTAEAPHTKVETSLDFETSVLKPEKSGMQDQPVEWPFRGN